MSLVEILIVIIVGFLCIYSVVDRICKCIENTNTMTAYNDYLKNKKKEIE